MATSVVRLFDEACEMPEADRAALAGLLLESLDQPAEPGVEAAWAREIERRAKELDEGMVTAIPWEEARARLLARHHSGR